MSSSVSNVVSTDDAGFRKIFVDREDGFHAAAETRQAQDPSTRRRFFLTIKTSACRHRRSGRRLPSPARSMSAAMPLRERGMIVHQHDPDEGNFSIFHGHSASPCFAVIHPTGNLVVHLNNACHSDQHCQISVPCRVNCGIFTCLSPGGAFFHTHQTEPAVGWRFPGIEAAAAVPDGVLVSCCLAEAEG